MTRRHPILAGAVILMFVSASAVICCITIVQRARGDQPPATEAPASPAKTRAEYVPPTAATKTGSEKTTVAKPTPHEDRQREKALDALAKVYALKPNEALKSFSSRFPPERGAYLDTLYPKLPHAGQDLDGYIWIVFTWKDGLKYKNATVHSAPAGLGRRVLDVMTGLLDCPEQEIEGDETILSKGIAADFVVREDAPPEKVVARLAEIFKDRFHLAVNISIKEQEREVFVLKGKYKPNPSSAGRFEIYGHEIIDPDQGGGGDGTFREMLGHMGDWIKRRIVAEVEGAPDYVSWHFNWRAPFTKELLAEDQNPDSVMKHLAEQTGLNVNKEKRRVRVFAVEAVK